MSASREMFSDELVEAMENLHQYPRLIAERAAKEAVAARNAQIAEAVRGLPDRSGTTHPYDVGWEDARAAVLATLTPGQCGHDDGLLGDLVDGARRAASAMQEALG